MPATEAQIRANRENSKKSTGPVTSSGKEASRANALKHGLTATLLIPEREAAEIDRRYLAYCEELQPTGEVGMALTRHAARMTARMERCEQYENMALIDLARQAEADFVAPEGADDATIARLRHEAAKRALFDASPVATLVRKYELAAERGFFRALKELRQLKNDHEAQQAEQAKDELASISPGGLKEMSDDEFEVYYAKMMAETPQGSRGRLQPGDFADVRGRVDVPITVGQRR